MISRRLLSTQANPIWTCVVWLSIPRYMPFEIPLNYRFLTKKNDRRRPTYLYIWTDKNNNDNHVNGRLSCLSTCAHSRWGLALAQDVLRGGVPKHLLLDPTFGLEWPLKCFPCCRCWALSVQMLLVWNKAHLFMIPRNHPTLIKSLECYIEFIKNSNQEITALLY